MMVNFPQMFEFARDALQGRSGQRPSSAAPGWQSRVQDAVAALTGDAPRTPSTGRPAAPGDGEDADRGAVARYEYLLRTAPPEQLEQVHTDAFAQLTPAQRELLLQRMRTELPAAEQPAAAAPAVLGRAATRAEARRPGTARRLLAGAGAAGVAAGAGGLLVAVAGGAVASGVAAPVLAQAAGLGVDFEALAQGVDLEGLIGGLGETVSGVGEQITGAGETLTGLADGIQLPGLNDLF